MRCPLSGADQAQPPEPRKIAPDAAEFHNPPMNDCDQQLSGARCAWSGCQQPGHYRAPKDRSLTGYVYFCLDHVRAYNAMWDFHAGLDQNAIESELRSAATWDRPTWKLGALGRGPGSWRDTAVDDARGRAAGTAFDPRQRAGARG